MLNQSYAKTLSISLPRRYRLLIKSEMAIAEACARAFAQAPKWVPATATTTTTTIHKQCGKQWKYFDFRLCGETTTTHNIDKIVEAKQNQQLLNKGRSSCTRANKMCHGYFCFIAFISFFILFVIFFCLD